MTFGVNSKIKKKQFLLLPIPPFNYLECLSLDPLGPLKAEHDQYINKPFRCYHLSIYFSLHTVIMIGLIVVSTMSSAIYFITGRPCQLLNLHIVCPFVQLDDARGLKNACNKEKKIGSPSSSIFDEYLYRLYNHTLPPYFMNNNVTRTAFNNIDRFHHIHNDSI